MNRAVFLDRDGTLIKNEHYLSDPRKIKIYKGVVFSLLSLQKQGWKLIVGTNQAGIGRGLLTVQRLDEIHKKLFGIFEKQGLKIDAVYFCPHHPNDHCKCRKPQTKMILQAQKKFHLNLKQCVVVGDNESDIRWGQNVGAQTILVLTGYGKRTFSEQKVKPNVVVRSFPYAAKWILNHLKN